MKIQFCVFPSAWFIPFLALLLACIKDPPLNPEADIEAFAIPEHLKTAEVVIDHNSRRILLFLTKEAFETGLAPQIKTSARARITPLSGDSIHFTMPVNYTVTSEDGHQTRTYDVKVVSVGNWVFNFETWATDSLAHFDYPTDSQNTGTWSTGNMGAAYAGVPLVAQHFPTQRTTSGLNGTLAAMMITKPGTPLSEIMNVHLLAGSLFTGSFNLTQVLLNPLKATEFGIPYVGKPARFTGYYSYVPGPDFQERSGTIVPGHSDSCSIYAVLFAGPERLDGTNIQNSSRIIARAELPDGTARPNFTRFDLPFTFFRMPDPGEKLLLAIVASSSADGDHYRGAIGSTLIVDSLRIIPE